MADTSVILASASPRRKELLGCLFSEFKVVPANVDEASFLTHPLTEGVQAASRAKAQVACADRPSALVIAADTVVVIDGEALGKPASPDEARRMLKKLSGRTHEVLTGIAVAWHNEMRTDAEVTRVEFGPLTPEQIEAYVGTGEPMDKAGAYAIQGRASLFVRRIEGCYFNVVGLPLFRLGMLLGAFGIHPWKCWLGDTRS